MANAIINLAVIGACAMRLQWLLNDDDAQVRATAFDGLIKLAEPEGPAGEIDLAELALRTQTGEIRTRALQLLVKHGATAQNELATRIDGLLGHALDDEAENVRREAMRRCGPGTASAETTLRRAVTSVHPTCAAGPWTNWLAKARQSRAWAREPLIERVGDSAAEVGGRLRGSDQGRRRQETRQLPSGGARFARRRSSLSRFERRAGSVRPAPLLEPLDRTAANRGSASVSRRHRGARQTAAQRRTGVRSRLR